MAAVALLWLFRLCSTRRIYLLRRRSFALSAYAMTSGALPSGRFFSDSLLPDDAREKDCAHLLLVFHNFIVEWLRNKGMMVCLFHYFTILINDELILIK